MFIWKACHEALLTAANLARRTGSMGERGHVACVIHLKCQRFISCYIVHPLDRFGHCPTSLEDYFHHETCAREWVWQAYTSLQPDISDQFLVVCWGLWLHRIKVVKESSVASAFEVVRRALLFQGEYKEAFKSIRVRQPS
ncbi:hypothetical protein Salat_2425800 [Sesamum alatum]|uniref:Uncharacterized protein n=1 Tax=Sesamum alatum TaxID=300844 RepID=A0AAE1XY56_9LAMI|nr:hypothetical protein Salat_2425800 [Sesamum alatum]